MYRLRCGMGFVVNLHICLYFHSACISWSLIILTASEWAFELAKSSCQESRMEGKSGYEQWMLTLMMLFVIGKYSVNTLLNLLMGKGCVSQILLGPFLNTWSHISLSCGLAKVLNFSRKLLVELPYGAVFRFLKPAAIKWYK